MKRFSVVVIFLTLLSGCSSDNGTPENEVPVPQPQGFERAPMLANWADNIIIPGYEAFITELTELNDAVARFEQDSNEGNLAALRDAWLEAYRAWQRVSMFEIGPAEQEGLRLNINTYPVNISKLEGHVASRSYDLTLPSNRDAKGFPALDYLLNGLGDTDEAIISKFNEGGMKDSYVGYISDVVANMQQMSSTVLVGWTDGYRDTFVGNDGASSTASVDRFVNDYIFYYEKFLRAGKMGIPLGVFSGSPLPENVEGYYKGDIAKELFLEGLDAVQGFFNGRHFNTSQEGQSLSSYLEALNALKDGDDLSEIINTQLNTARESVTALDNFRAELENEQPPTNMLLAYDEVQRVVPLLKVDMVSAMSISIDFVDADGD